MDLNKFIPDDNSNWVVKSGFLEHIPICYVEDDIVYVFLDMKLYKQVIKVINHLMSLNVEFYLTTPEASNPKGVIDLKEKVIYHYLISYAKDKFFYGFQKIEFDLVDNLVKWTDKEDCFDLVKDVYDKVMKKINHQSWDYYSNKKHFDYSKEIRDEFQSLYRHIQISRII